jgi:DNA polymerase III epsilon subunit-like protein
MKPTTEEFAEMKEAAARWAKERLDDPCTVVLDLETTGILNRDPDTEICQIAITDTKGKPLFCMLLKPCQPMNEEVMGIHGITNPQVVSQPMFSQVEKMISFVLRGKHVVSFNMDFDWKLLMHMFKKYQCETPQIAGASCAMDKYSEWKGEWNDKKAGVRWQKLPNLSGMPAHDAFSDCVSTLKVIEMMANKYDPAAVEADTIDLDF